MINILRLVEDSNRILILPHKRPDGDAIGSSVALKVAIEKLNKKATILTYDALPFFFYTIFDNHRNLIDSEYKDSPDLIICLDSSDYKRVEDRLSGFSGCKVASIDHHVTNEYFADENFVDSSASSTGELVYDLISTFMKVELDNTIASALYMAISSDTGRFSYSNTTSRTHAIVSELHKHIADVADINVKMYQSVPMNKFMLNSHSLANAEFHFDGKFALTLISNTDIASFGTDNTDDIAENLRDIDGVEVSALIIERDSEFKVSMRSKKFVNVSSIAQEMGGGGHVRAAGYSVSNTSISEIKDGLIKKVGEQL